MSFSEYLRSKLNYTPIKDQDDFPVEVLPSDNCEQIWSKIKDGLKWEELPTDIFIAFPEDVKDWTAMYCFCKGWRIKSFEKLDDFIQRI